jgi:hypothetical protein
VDATEEDGGGSVIARGEASAVLEAAEHALDGVTPLVEAAAEAALSSNLWSNPSTSFNAVFSPHFPAKST